MDQNRRTFALQMAGLAAVFAGIGTASAAQHQHETQVSSDGWKLDADTKFHCGTCQFGGGMRKVADDKKQVVAVSLGWCNNPAGPMYRALTTK